MMYPSLYFLMSSALAARVLASPLNSHNTSSLLVPDPNVPDPEMDALSQWLDEHQHETSNGVKFILSDSREGDNYSFAAAFNLFVLDGDIDLSTHQISGGSFYVDAPEWGRVNIMDDISGDLNGPITCNFHRGPNINGSLILTLDKNTKDLTIDYDLAVKFLGPVTDKLALFSLPPSNSASPSPEQISAAVSSVLTCDTYTEEHQLFDKFLIDHYDEDTKNFIIESYRSEGETGAPAGASRIFTFNVSFLGVFQLEGSVDTTSFRIVANLFVRVPFFGRVRVVGITGDLKNGINIPIDVFIAKGTIGFKLVGRDVRFLVDLDVKIVGRIKNDIRLFTLPF